MRKGKRKRVEMFTNEARRGSPLDNEEEISSIDHNRILELGLLSYALGRPTLCPSDYSREMERYTAPPVRGRSRDAPCLTSLERGEIQTPLA